MYIHFPFFSTQVIDCILQTRNYCEMQTCLNSDVPNKLLYGFSEKYLETGTLSNLHLNLILSFREIIKGLIKCIGLNINKTLALDLTIDQVYLKQRQISKVMFVSDYNKYFRKVSKGW